MDGHGTIADDVSRKRPAHLLFTAGMILPAAFLYLVVSGQPHVFLIVVVGLVVSAFYRKEIPYSDRSIIYSVLLALVLAALLDMVFPMRRDKMMFGRLFASNISVPFVLYLAVLSTFFESGPYTLGFAAATSLMAIMMGGDYRPLFGGQTTGWDSLYMFVYLRERFDVFFSVVASVEMLALIAAFIHGRQRFTHKHVSASNWLKRLVFAGALALAAGLTISAVMATRIYKNQIRDLETYLGSLRPRVTPSRAKVFFGKDIDLNTSILANRSKNRDVVLLRAIGDGPPGYLRGRVYQYYSHGHWSVSLNVPMKETAGKGNIDGLALNAFDLTLRKGRGDLEKALDIYPTDSNMAGFLFLPGNAERVEIVADKLSYSGDGFFRPKGWESDGGYTVRFKRFDPESAFPKPAMPSPLLYLYTPKEMISVLDRTLDDVFGGENFVTLYNDTEKIDMLVDFFQKNFSYTLKPKAPFPGEDPLTGFLTRNHAGHCELFASSAALLLRRLGIPTRYVAGLLCREAHPSGGYYVARLRDAHAWIEAYDRERKMWVLVDATPAAEDNVQAHKTWGFWEAWADRLKQALAKALADARRGYVARAILALVTEIGPILFGALATVPGGLMAASLIGLFLYSRFRRRVREEKSAPHSHISGEVARLRREILRLERRTSKLVGARRGESETLPEWVDSLGRHGVDSVAVAQIRELVDEYNRMRFASASADPERARSLLQNIRAFRLIRYPAKT